MRFRDVEAKFKVSRRTVENWRDQGLECVTIGRGVYTSLEAVIRFSKPDQEAFEDSDIAEDEAALDEMGCKAKP